MILPTVDPLVAVITNVGMDHMDYLGSTIQEITRVKAESSLQQTLLTTRSTEIIKEVCQK